MVKSFIELVVGNLEDKKEWNQLKKRVKNLPPDYRYAYKNILKYSYYFTCDIEMLINLVDLFETSAAEGKNVQDVIGKDVAEFCDELMKTATIDKTTAREKLNKEIADYFSGKEI